jgi:nicotinate-nucleotide adenylyltransferase
MKKIALFGGSFDPPHAGHIAIVEAALEQLDIDKVVIVPAYLNPFKSHAHAPASLRLKWLRKIYDGNDCVAVSDFEIAKQRPVPTIETVRHFLATAEKLYVIIGADNLAALEAWYAFTELDALVTWVVARRDGINVPDRFATLDIDSPVSSTDLRRAMAPHELPAPVADEIAAYYKENNATKN